MENEIERLVRDLTLNEFERGKALFNAMKGLDIPSTKAAALCYRAGYRQAIKDDRARRNRYHTERLAREAEEAKRGPKTLKDRLIAGYEVLSLEEQEAASRELEAMHEDVRQKQRVKPVVIVDDLLEVPETIVIPAMPVIDQQIAAVAGGTNQ